MKAPPGKDGKFASDRTLKRLLMRKIIELLTKPYPYLFSPGRNLIIALTIGLLVAGINFMGIQQSTLDLFLLDKHLIITLTGTTSFIGILLVIELLPRLVFSQRVKEQWTTGKEFLMVVFLLVVIAFLNNIVFFSIYRSANQIHYLDHLLNSIYFVLIIGSLPTALIIWMNYTIILRRNLAVVRSHNLQLQERLRLPIEKPSEQPVSIPTQNKQETLVFDVHQFLYARSEGNYLEVYTSTPKEVRRSVCRLSLQQLAAELEQYPFIFCPHRSFLINMHRITATSGNARNYRVQLEGTDIEIPVSRTKFEAFNTAFMA